MLVYGCCEFQPVQIHPENRRVVMVLIIFLAVWTRHQMFLNWSVFTSCDMILLTARQNRSNTFFFFWFTQNTSETTWDVTAQVNFRGQTFYLCTQNLFVSRSEWDAPALWLFCTLKLPAKALLVFNSNSPHLHWMLWKQILNVCCKTTKVLKNWKRRTI